MRTNFLRGAAALALAVVCVSGAEIPRPAPELQIRMVNGKDLQLSSFKGKVVALEFLLTTCPHCQRASQALNRVYRDLGPQGFQPVGVAVNEMANMLVADYVKQFNLTFPVGYAHRDDAVRFLQHPIMMAMQFPQLVIIDKAGVVQQQLRGDDPFFNNEEKNLRDTVQALLKPGKPAGKLSSSSAGTSAPPAAKKK